MARRTGLRSAARLCVWSLAVALMATTSERAEAAGVDPSADDPPNDREALAEEDPPDLATSVTLDQEKREEVPADCFVPDCDVAYYFDITVQHVAGGPAQTLTVDLSVVVEKLDAPGKAIKHPAEPVFADPTICVGSSRDFTCTFDETSVGGPAPGPGEHRNFRVYVNRPDFGTTESFRVLLTASAESTPPDLDPATDEATAEVELKGLLDIDLGGEDISEPSDGLFCSLAPGTQGRHPLWFLVVVLWAAARTRQRRRR